MDPLQVDHYWQNAILGLIGETLSPDICGVRIVDKGKRDNTMYRFEVWLKSNDQEVVRSVKEKFLRCISEGKDFKRGPPQFDWKKHK